MRSSDSQRQKKCLIYAYIDRSNHFFLILEKEIAQMN